MEPFSVITLDRLIEGEEIYHDTLVYKFDRGITVKSNAGTGHVIPFGLYYSDSSSNKSRNWICTDFLSSSVNSGSISSTHNVEDAIGVPSPSPVER